MKPLRGKVLVDILSNYSETKSGIVIAETVNEVPTKGRCIAVGAKPRDKKGKEIDWGIEIGSQVYFKQRFGVPYEPLQGKIQRFLSWEDIVGVS